MDRPLEIINWPDPRLKKISQPVTTFDASLRELATRMLELMKAAKGVGLAAPQAGVNLRLFVMNPDGEPDHDRVYVNPVLSDGEGDEEAEEGCLSLPKIHLVVNRAKTMRVRAQDLDGHPFEQTETGYPARIWQHETDHLNGVLLLDRMGPGTKLLHRKILKELEEEYAAAHPVRPPAKRVKSKR